MNQKHGNIQTKKLRVLSQGLIFTLSPLIIPSLLCLGLVLLSFFSDDWLHKFSIPLVFSMVLITIPVTLTGLIISMIRKIICFRSYQINVILWVSLAFTMSAVASMKFMSWISIQFIDVATVMGICSALIACTIILLIESKNHNTLAPYGHEAL